MLGPRFARTMCRAWSPRDSSRIPIRCSVCVCVCVCQWLSRVRLFATPWTAAHQAPLSLGFSRQEYWSGLPCPSPEDLPDPGIEPMTPVSPALAGGFFTTSADEAQKGDLTPHSAWETPPDPPLPGASLSQMGTRGVRVPFHRVSPASPWCTDRSYGSQAALSPA